MLHFLKILYESRPAPHPDLWEEVVAAAIERAVNKTDGRLKAISAYRKRLHGPVEAALRHTVRMVDRLPEPVEISPGRYAEDPKLRAIFASAEHLSEVLGHFRTLREYLEGHSGLPPDQIFGLLSVAHKEKQTLGMEIDGDRVTRDVLQTVVTFGDHQFLAPNDAAEAARSELTTQAFDFLLESAKESITEQKLRRGELSRQRQLLRRKLLSPVSDPAGTADYGALEAEIAAIDEALGEFSGIELSLEESLQRLQAVLAEAETWISLVPYQAAMDYRNVKTRSADTLMMDGLGSVNGLCRVVLFGFIPRLSLSHRTGHDRP